ncbi:MAG: hypothetical protein KKA64_04430 [Nanoarchaeota archaeon]|nr:hypothetical protein [Nanoarchaeota archaeon]
MLSKAKILRNKKAQFYLLAAIVIIVIILGAAGTVNYLKKSSEVKIYDLKEELGFEGGSVLDFGTYNEYSDPDMGTLLDHFTSVYTTYSGEDKEIYFLFGDAEGINKYTYNETAIGDVSIDIGGTGVGVEVTEKKTSIEKLIVEGNKVKIDIEGETYEFTLKPGENFYFIISQNIGGEDYVVQS